MPSMERVRFVSSGTEAAMSAIRVARAATKRDKIVKFEGCYHGHADAFLVQAGSGAMTLGVPTSPGVPRGGGGRHDRSRATTTWRRSSAALRRGIATRSPPSSSSRLPATWASSPPADGFLAGCARSAIAHGVLLDLRRSDFRIPRGGRRRAAGVSASART